MEKKETKIEIKCLIDEIRFNFEYGNIYVTTLSLFTLIEHKINTVIEENKTLIKKNNENILITQTIKNVLKNNCFKHNCFKNDALDRIYDKFVHAYYKSTDGDLDKITRHMVHGKRLDLINKKQMLSLIFFTDCVYKMLFIENQL